MAASRGANPQMEEVCARTGWSRKELARRETAQRVAVDRILAGEFLLITAERAVQIGQHEPLQLVPDLAFLRYVEHRLFGHASYRSCPVRPSLVCAERWRSKVASCRNALG